MSLLEKIKTCSSSELNGAVKDELKNKFENSEQGLHLGFPYGVTPQRITPHKGFISPNSIIKYNSYSMGEYSMKTKDFYFEFAQYLKDKDIQNTIGVVRAIQPFSLDYFGKPNGIDKRDEYFYAQASKASDEEDYFDNLEIGDMKGKGIAMCSDRAALAQNLLSLFDVESYYCFGCVNANGKEESHAFNFVKAPNKCAILDYSLPVSVFQDGKVVGYYPYEAWMPKEDLNDVLKNNVNKKFPDYEYHVNEQGQMEKRVFGEREYVVGSLSLDKKKTIKM